MKRIALLVLIFTLGASSAEAALRETPDGIPIQHPSDKLPLFVTPSPEVAAWMPEIRQITDLYNKLIGSNVFIVLGPRHIPHSENPPLVITASHEMGTQLNVDARTGLIVSSEITLSMSESYSHTDKLAILLHAFGMILGLAELETADKPYDIMAREFIRAGGRVLPHDIETLRRLYGKTSTRLMRSDATILWL